MSISVNFMRFNKRINSTAVPSGGGTAYGCLLKDDTSLHSPVFQMQFGMDFNPSSYNYCYVPSWGCYYFVEEWTYVNRLWHARCYMDVLATYKSDILATKAFLLYSEASGNKELVDSRLAKVTTPQMRILDNVDIGYGTTPCYILRTIGANGGTSGYLMGDGDFANLGNILSDPTFTTTLTQQYGDVYGCILGCMHFPFSPPTGAHSGTHIYLGTYDTGVSASAMSVWKIVHTRNITVPRIYNDWRDEACITYHLWLPYVGAVELSASDIIGATLAIQVGVEFITGSLVYHISAVQDGNTGITRYYDIGSFTGMCGSAVPITGYQSNASGVIAGIGQMGTGAVSGGVTGGMAGGVGGAVVGAGLGAIGGIANTINAYKSHTACIIGGATGESWSNMGVWSTDIILSALINPTNINPETVKDTIGIPCMEPKLISTQDGYVMTANFAVSGGMDKTEKQEINALMDGGVWIE